MQKLTAEEKLFIEGQDILESEIFDAEGMTGRQFRAEMKSLGFNFALGKPCQKAGHRLRTRSNHCIQCDTSKIAYQRRWTNPGEVYVASASDTSLIKVGTSIDSPGRVYNLNREAYGGSRNWRIVHLVEHENAGYVEHLAHSILRRHNVTGTYVKDGRLQACRELFNCSFESAIKAVEDAGNGNAGDSKYAA